MSALSEDSAQKLESQDAADVATPEESAVATEASDGASQDNASDGASQDNASDGASQDNASDGASGNGADAKTADDNASDAPVRIEDPAAERKLRRESKRMLKEARKLYKRAKKRLSEPRCREVETAVADMERALQSEEYSCAKAHDALGKVIQTRLAFARKSQLQEIFESLLIALGFALLLRTFLVEPFKIPTRSMVPTLLEGDQLFVTKLSYGIRLPFYDHYVVRFSAPQRGDVVVFAFPSADAAEYLARTNSGCLAAESLAGDKDYIKRIIGVEGDTVEVIDQVVYVNGEPVKQVPYYERTVSDFMYLTDRRREAWNHEEHGVHKYTTITHEVQNNHFGPIKVQPDHVFVMGDNRDNSADSRCWGQVPVDNIKGRAQIIWWSTGHVGLRTERMFTTID